MKNIRQRAAPRFVSLQEHDFDLRSALCNCTNTHSKCTNGVRISNFHGSRSILDLFCFVSWVLTLAWIAHMICNRIAKGFAIFVLDCVHGSIGYFVLVSIGTCCLAHFMMLCDATVEMSLQINTSYYDKYEESKQRNFPPLGNYRHSEMCSRSGPCITLAPTAH
eukprot:m.815122 g.815122  ORF g.815122 m.815122 type:complete len:164 (+) comp23394_c0_seq37:960-1451(+)